MTDGKRPNFEGHGGSGTHRTVGPHRAWCHDCQEWCYPINEGEEFLWACPCCRELLLMPEVRS